MNGLLQLHDKSYFLFWENAIKRFMHVGVACSFS